MGMGLAVQVMAGPPPGPPERHACNDRHHRCYYVEQHVHRVHNAAGQKPLDALVDDADHRCDRDCKQTRHGNTPSLAGPLQKRLVDEDGHHPILDQMGALSWHRHPNNDQEVGSDNAKSDAYLRATRSNFKALRDHSCEHKNAAEEKEPDRQEVAPQLVDQVRANPRVE